MIVTKYTELAYEIIKSVGDFPTVTGLALTLAIARSLEKMELDTLQRAAMVCLDSAEQWESMGHTDTIAARAGEARMNAGCIMRLRYD